jgi:hypothetical protein
MALEFCIGSAVFLIFVGEDKTSSAADYYLDASEQLYHWLRRLLEGR